MSSSSSLKLVIGNRTYSSWSLRGYLLLTEADLAGVAEVEVSRIPLFTPEWDATIATLSPARRVPILHDGALTVWDTAAMAEHLLERFPGRAVGWPADAAARALARSVAAEMHSGFLAVREELPFNVRRGPRAPPQHPLSDACEAQVARILAMWRDCFDKYGGPFLFGDTFGIADVMYAPVALRFLTYGVAIDDKKHPEAQRYVDAVLGLESVKTWIAAAKQEEEHIDFIDSLGPIKDEPITLG